MGQLFDSLQRSQPNIDRALAFLNAKRAERDQADRRQRLQDFFAKRDVMNPGQQESADQANNMPETSVDMSDRTNRLKAAMGQSQLPPVPAAVSTVGPQTHTEQKDISNLSTQDVLGINDLLEGPASQGITMAMENDKERRARLNDAMKAKREGTVIVPRGAQAIDLDSGKVTADNPMTFAAGKPSEWQSLLGLHGGDVKAALDDHDERQRKLIETRGDQTRATNDAKTALTPEDFFEYGDDLKPIGLAKGINAKQKIQAQRQFQQQAREAQKSMDNINGQLMYLDKDRDKELVDQYQQSLAGYRSDLADAQAHIVILRNSSKAKPGQVARPTQLAPTGAPATAHVKTAVDPKTGKRVGYNPTTKQWESIPTQ